MCEGLLLLLLLSDRLHDRRVNLEERRRRRRKRKRMAREMKRGGDNRKKKMRKEVHTYMGWQAGMFYKQTKSLPGVWYSKELLRTKRVFKSWN